MDKTKTSSDIGFLSQFDPELIILQEGSGKPFVVISPKYQGKVFTSGVADSGPSFGWINYEAIESKDLDPHMNAYGGESRMWLGPEGGQFSIFFEPQSEFEFESWKTPPPIDHEAWELVSKTASAVTIRKKAAFTNYSGFNFDIELTRDVELLSKESIYNRLGLKEIQDVSVVGYETNNQIKNVGTESWVEETGAICIWILDMFKPSDQTVIIIPYNEQSNFDPIVKSDYFGEIPKNRLQVLKKAILFRADGRQRGKIGVPPLRARPIAGSVDLKNNTLTVVQFDVDTTGKYMNQEWKLHERPYQGDAVNAYNDGPLENGEQMGPFYEIESVSPAAFLDPGDAVQHLHSVYHFVGDREQIIALMEYLFEVRLNQIENFLINE